MPTMAEPRRDLPEARPHSPRVKWLQLAGPLTEPSLTSQVDCALIDIAANPILIGVKELWLGIYGLHEYRGQGRWRF